MIDDPLADLRRPHMARAYQSLGGVPVVISSRVPRMHVGDEIAPLMPHWLVAWLFRLLGLPVWPVCYLRGKKIEREQIFEMGGKLFMTPAAWEELKACRDAS